MGKKHKKHKLSSQDDGDDEGEKPPIKLVLKLGSEVMYDSDFAVNSPASIASDSLNHKHKKRKKKSLPTESKDDDNGCSPKMTFPSQEETSTVLESLSPPEEEAFTMLESRMDDAVPDKSPSLPEDVNDIKVELLSNLAASAELQLPVKIITKTTLNPAMRKALNNLLEHLLKQLEQKDVNEIFSWPMNDMIAVGYSSVINNPMDFSTMRNKIFRDQYFNVEDFKQDFELIVENCCAYYTENSVYCDVARRVLTTGRKVFSKDRLINLRKTLTFLQDFSFQELSDIFGCPLSEEECTRNVTKHKTDAVSTSHKNVEDDSQGQRNSVVPDTVHDTEMSEKTFYAKKLKSEINFLHMDDEGNTTLNIVNRERNENFQIADIGSLTGNTTSGVDIMPEAKEDKRNKVTPLEYLSYGPFSSFAPTFDSRTSNLTQEESDILLSAYGTDAGYFISQNTQESTPVTDSVDTNGFVIESQSEEEMQHKKHSKNREVTPSAYNQHSAENVKVDFKRLETLKELGIDISFLKEVELKHRKWNEESNFIYQKLKHGNELLRQLEKEQYSRLSLKTVNNEPNLEPPTSAENEIAAELRKTLLDLTAAATPAAVCDQTGVRKAMGIVPIL